MDGTRYPATANIDNIEFLSDKVKVRYVSVTGKTKDVLVEYPKK